MVVELLWSLWLWLLLWLRYHYNCIIVIIIIIIVIIIVIIIFIIIVIIIIIIVIHYYWYYMTIWSVLNNVTISVINACLLWLRYIFTILLLWLFLLSWSIAACGRWSTFLCDVRFVDHSQCVQQNQAACIMLSRARLRKSRTIGWRTQKARLTFKVFDNCTWNCLQLDMFTWAWS